MAGRRARGVPRPPFGPRPAAPVPAAPTAQSFLACLRQSGLVPADRLDAFLDGRDLGGEDDENARALAKDLVGEKLLTRWQADKVLAGRCRGFKLGSYTLLSLLGKGGMSAVYLAEHNVMRRKCAVKVLPGKLVGGGSHLERFLREARAVAALDHPNIVRAYDVASEGEGANATYFLVMELVVGRSLYDLVKRDGPPDADRVRRIGRECALGLAHAHAAGIVHRDVKPGNVLLANSGAVKVTDLGLARGDDEEHSLTVAHDEKVLGTADYLAPEQALDSHTVDSRADVYGLGCTLYFALCGHGPFTDGTLAQRLMAHQATPAPPIESVVGGVPGDLAAAIGRMLEKKPGDRFQTMEEVAAALAPPAAGNEGGPPTPTPAAEEEPTERELSDFLANLGDGGSDGDGGAGGEPGSGGPRSATRPAAKTGPKSGRGGKAGRRSGRAATPETPRFAAPDAAVPADELPPFPFAPADAVGGADAGGGEAADEPSAPSGPFDFAAHGAADEPPPTRPRRSSRRPTRQSSGRTRAAAEDDADRGPSKWPLVAAAAAGLATAAAVIAWLTLVGGDDSDDRPLAELGSATAGAGGAADPAGGGRSEGGGERPGPAGGPLAVGPGGDFPTLAAALEHLQSGAFRPRPGAVQVVALPAGALREALVIDSSDFSFPKGVKIVGDAAGTTLNPPGDGPAVSLKALAEFTLENVAVDAAGRAVAVEVGGYLARVRLAGVRVENLSGTGLLLDGVVSGGLRTEIVDFTAEAADANAVGVRVAGAGATGVTLAGGSLTGPLAAGVDLAADTAQFTAETLAVGPAAAGVRIGGVKLKDVTLRDLTFAGVDRGVQFAGGPTGGGELTLAGNAFADAAEPVAVDGHGDAAEAVLDAGASAGNSAANPGDDPLGLFE